jgi:hypothetical protein
MKSPESSPIIEIATGARSAGKKPEKSGQSEKSHIEKTQAELREALGKRFGTLTADVQASLDNYDQMLEDGTFEDKDGEEAGAGDKRKEVAQAKIEGMMERTEKMKKTLDSKEELPQSVPQIEAQYTPIDAKTGKRGSPETITLDIEKKTQEFLDFYKKTGVDTPPDFESDIQDIWDRNSLEIQEAIEQNGFDEMLIIPANIPLADLADKMKMGKGYYTGSYFDQGGGFAGAKSSNVDKPRIILYHKMSLPEITAKTGLDTHLNITGGDMEKLYLQNPDQYLSTLEDFLVMEKVNETTHISDYTQKSATWLVGTKSGSRLVISYWRPDSGKLCVYADDLGYQSGDLGARPSRSFF